ncbi:hypothetical protein KVT40_001374 [Elsinoe batatas]|uniref:Uncharacterized protein n=1 Tax=Elsinoe batatas TaxID=2601811 RepID=A0A8K0L935_9PEZI|nr:hypothetical protein KVT40_001374 [Elsinoe batatas]
MLPAYTAAQSPLPDSSALEAGLILDSGALNTNSIQDDVRHLLLDVPLSGRLVYSDVCRTPRDVTPIARTYDDDVKCRSVFEEYAAIDEEVVSPKKEGSYAPSLLEYYSRSPRVDLETGMVLFPPYDKNKEKIPTIAYRRRTKRRRVIDRETRFRFMTCIVLACFLAALVAAYVSQAVPPRNLHPALHTVFVVSIIFNSVLLAYYASRLTRMAPVPRHLWAVRPHHRRHRHVRSRHSRRRWPSTPSICSSAASITSSAGLLRTPTPLRPSPKQAYPVTRAQATPHCPPPAAVQTEADLLPTPPAARTARPSTHSTYLGEFYIQDMKPMSSPSSPVRSPPTRRPSVQEPVPEATQLHSLSPRSMQSDLRPPPLFLSTHLAIHNASQLSPALAPSHPSPHPRQQLNSTTPEILPSTTFTPSGPRSARFINRPSSPRPPSNTNQPHPSPLSPSLPHNPLNPSTPIPSTTQSVPHEGEGEEEGSILIHPPPPAYGRWRGSIRVDPDLLSWTGAGGLCLGEVEGRGLPGYDDHTGDFAGRV